MYIYNTQLTIVYVACLLIIICTICNVTWSVVNPK